MRTVWMMSTIAAVVALAAVSRGAKLPTFGDRWEYRIDAPSDAEFEEFTNGCGAEGWELVTARPSRDVEGCCGYEVVMKRRAR